MTESIAGRTVLVTGGAGFIGSHLVDALLPDNDVRILDDFSAGVRERPPDAATVIEGDVGDPETVRRAVDSVDIVFHQAAIVSVDRSVEAPTTSHGVNIDGTLAVLEAARAEDARVVFASSAAIYGSPEALPVDEAHPKEPLSPYGLEKLTADHYCRLYAELYGLPTVALRYFNVYGSRQTGGEYAGVITAFGEQARAGGPLTIHGDGEQTRDFVHVDDVVQANILAAQTDATGEAFNVGTGTETSITDLAETIRDHLDPSAELTHVDPREGDIRRSVADIEKTRDALGYEPTTELSEGLQEYLR